MSAATSRPCALLATHVEGRGPRPAAPIPARGLAGVRASDPLFGQLPEIGLVTELGGRDRNDLPEPPAQPQTRNGKSAPKAPKRPADYGYAYLERQNSGQSEAQEQNPEREPDAPEPRSIWADDRED